MKSDESDVPWRIKGEIFIPYFTHRDLRVLYCWEYGVAAKRPVGALRSPPNNTVLEVVNATMSMLCDSLRHRHWVPTMRIGQQINLFTSQTYYHDIVKRLGDCRFFMTLSELA